MSDPKIDALVARLYPDLCDHLRPKSERCLSCELDSALAAIQRVRELAEGIIERYDHPKIGTERNAAMLIQRHFAVDILAALDGNHE